MSKLCSLFSSFAVIAVLLTGSGQADQPRLGFQGTLVKCRYSEGCGVGYRVDRVQRGSLAHKMGLERGDVVFRIGNMEFASHEAYLYTLRQMGEILEIQLVNVRNGKIVKRRCRLGHDPSHHGVDQLPEGGISIID